MARATRNPEARRQAIVDAAAELLLEIGLHEVTHRKVAERAQVPLGSTTQYFANRDELLMAAMTQLGQASDAALDELEHQITCAADIPHALAEFFGIYLADRERARAEAVFYVANIEHPHMRSISNAGYARMEQILNRYISPTATQTVMVYTDGLILTGCMRNTPLDQEFITTTLQKLLEV